MIEFQIPPYMSNYHFPLVSMLLYPSPHLSKVSQACSFQSNQPESIPTFIEYETNILQQRRLHFEPKTQWQNEAKQPWKHESLTVLFEVAARVDRVALRSPGGLVGWLRRRGRGGDLEGAALHGVGVAGPDPEQVRVGDDAEGLVVPQDAPHVVPLDATAAAAGDGVTDQGP